MPDPITARVEPPSPPRPPRPEMYALAVYKENRWDVYCAGARREWIEKYQQPLYEGSHLIVIPGEQAAHAAAKDAEIATLREQLRLALESRAEYVWLWKCGGDVPTDATKAADAALRASGVKLEDTP